MVQSAARAPVLQNPAFVENAIRKAMENAERDRGEAQVHKGEQPPESPGPEYRCMRMRCLSDARRSFCLLLKETVELEDEIFTDSLLFGAQGLCADLGLTPEQAAARLSSLPSDFARKHVLPPAGRQATEGGDLSPGALAETFLDVHAIMHLLRPEIGAVRPADRWTLDAIVSS